MDDLDRLFNRQMKDPEFREAWEQMQPEFEVMRAMLRARSEQNITQKELAARCGIRQSNISRIESGSCSPNLATLQAIAKGLGKELHIEFR